MTAMTLLNLILLALVKNSFQTHSDRVAHGLKAKQDQFPYFVQLKKSLPANESSYRLAWCGATLIHPRWILTAAHCFPNSPDYLSFLIDNKLIETLMGSWLKKGADAKRRRVVKVLIHKDFLIQYSDNAEHIESVENDIAIAGLETAYRLSQSIRVVKLPIVGRKLCKNGTIIGIGLNEAGAARHVYYANVRTTPVEELGEPAPPSNTTFYSKAGWKAAHALEGDSGGPFVCKFGAYSVQYGIVSNGFLGGNSRGHITQFTDVSKYIGFVADYVPEIHVLGQLKKSKRSDKKASGDALRNCTCIYLMMLLYCIVRKNS